MLFAAMPESRFDCLVAGLDEVPPGSIHGDLKPDHVMLADGRVGFLDLDSVALGDPVRDSAHFCSYLLGRVGLDALSVARARTLAGEFVDSYFSHVPRHWRRRFPLHCAGALVEVACGIFRHHGPRWREGMNQAVEEARLEGRDWRTQALREEARAGGPHCPGTYLAGGYNRLETEIAGRQGGLVTGRT